MYPIVTHLLPDGESLKPSTQWKPLGHSTPKPQIGLTLSSGSEELCSEGSLPK